MSDADDRTRQRDALLEATLPNVLFDGWSRAALLAGAESIGLDAAEIDRLFPGGPAEARLHLDEWADRRMVEALACQDLAGMRVRGRIHAAVMARLAVLAPYREAVRRAIAAKATPFGWPRAASAVYRTVDAVWHAAGDQSTDFNFYTKRALLAAAYAATVLYWLGDESEAAADTSGFLARRLDDIIRLPSLPAALGHIVRQVTAPFEVLRREGGR